jgi:enolase
VGEGLMMANTELLEAWISSGMANSVSSKANHVTRVSQTCLSYPKSSGSDRGYLKVIPAKLHVG